MQDDPFLTIAHRGARAFAPENTVPAIYMAHRTGAKVVELDVQMSKDGELIVFHDDDVSSCSDARQRFPGRADYGVGTFSWEELAVLDVGTWYVQELARAPSTRTSYLNDLTDDEIEQWIRPRDRDEYGSGSVRLPRLREALIAARHLQLSVVLDLKTIPRRYPALASRAVALVHELGMRDETMCTSFDHVLLADVRREDAEIAIGVLTNQRLYRVTEYLRALAADALHPGCSGEDDVLRRGVFAEPLDVDGITELRAAGYLVNVWTENGRGRMRSLIDAGVTGIFTDYPNRLNAVLAQIGRGPGSLSSVRRAHQR